ncbi:amino acid adenylation domain-containing protein [Duganella sp. FT92W]|uniref:Amino acid adenylation domain-containing protein n=1 Tax=Pseudoduganella rivuli TaxID=2666085 RepID=A0A7X2IL27_9BURK|nr:non-ribosomal peptide synthetase [Pseudoduganella rivuli]MRV71997.1 amino acid adenylation domain-containing protein [Pseudoduganella rivuli]
MTVNELLAKLAEARVTLSLTDGELRVKAPPGTMTPALLAELKAHKPALLNLLDRQDAAGLALADKRAVPATRTQLGIWMAEQAGAGSAYLMPAALQLDGALDTRALLAALTALTRRHPVLLSHFAWQDERLMLVRSNSAWQCAPVQSVAAQDADHAMAAFYAQPFDLAAGPLFRAAVLNLAPDRHLLLLALHHAVADGHSVNVLKRELAALYSRLSGQEAMPAPEEDAIGFENFAHWAGQQDTGPKLQYWLNQLASIPAPLRLPLAHAGHTASPAANPRLILDAAASAAVRRLAARLDCTPNMVMLAAFQLLLGRLSGAATVVTGIPGVQRPFAALADTVGLFLDVLPIKTTWQPDMTGDALLAQVRGSMIQALANDGVAFHDIVAGLDQPRTARHPVFQTFFNFMSQGEQEWRLTGLQCSALAPPAIASKFDLTLYVHDRPCFELEAHADTRRYSGATVALWLDQYRHLLARLCADSGQSVGAVALPGPRPGLAWPPRVDDLPRPEAQLRHWAEQTPGMPAVSAAGRTRTYAELQHDVAAMAHALAPRLTACGRPLALVSDRRYELVTAMYAALHLAIPFVVINAAYPAARINAILSACDAQCVLDLTGTAWPGATRLADLALPAAFSGLPPPGRPDQLAYLAVTSGSSGEPKLVQGQAAPLSHYARWARDELGMGTQVRCAMLSNVGHDPLLRDVFGCLGNGGHLLVPDMEMTATALAGWLERERPAVVGLSPALGRILTLHPDLARLTALRKLWFVGERLPASLVRQLRAALPHLHLYNFYGATETQQMLAVHRADDDLPYDIVPVGQAMPGGYCLVLNAAGEQAGTGEMGEVLFVSPLLSPGYAGGGDCGGFTRHQGLPAYRTGDRGFYDEAGRLHIAGRADRQVQIRGYRVAPEEVERVLLAWPGVAEVAVHVHGDAGEQVDAQLIAYVGAAPGCTLAPDQLAEFCRQHLPAPMLPSAFEILPQLPRNAHGKINYAALPRPRPDADHDTPPANPLEAQLAAIWRSVLGRESICCRRSLFAQGGHSLAAAHIVHAVARELGKELSLAQLFAHPTIAALAGLLATAPDAMRRDDALPAADVGQRHAPYPMSTLQRALYAARHAHDGARAVADTGCVELDISDFDLPRLSTAIQAVIARHDILRTVIVPGMALRVVPEIPPYVPQVHELGACGEADVEAQLAILRARMTALSFNHETWPNFAIHYVRLPHGRQRMLLALDILFLDYPSSQILLRDLMQAYEHGAAALGTLPLSLRDLMLHAQSPAMQQARARDQAYWLARVPGLPPAPRLPLADAAENTYRHANHHHRHWLSPGLWRGLQAQAGRLDCTPTALLLACFATVLERWSETSDFTVSLLLNERPAWHPAIAAMAGNFSSTLIYTHRRARESTLAAMATQCQHTLLEALSHRQFDGAEVMQAATRHHGRVIDQPVIFNSQLVHDAASTDAALPCLYKHIEGQARLWIEAIVCETAGGLELRWLSKDSLFPPGMVAAMFECFCQLAESAATPAAMAGALLPLPLPAAQAARRQRLNATAMALPTGLLHQPVIEQALRRPHATAVVQGDTRISYGQLLALADELAARLRAHGVANNELVAVHMEKSWRQVVAVLATGLAGAAYLPVDAGLPLARRRQLLELGQVRVVLVEQADAALGSQAQLAVAPLPAATGAGASAHPPLQSPVSPDCLAYVIFTSGSTGEPKGVMIRHSAARNTVEDINQRYAVGPADAVLGLSSLSFDLSVYDLFGVLGAGGKLVLAEPRHSRDPAVWRRLVERENVTLWNSVPALIQILSDYCGDDGIPRTLRCCLLSGDWIPVKLAARLRQSRPSMRLISLGGATEASIWSIYYPVTDVQPDWSSIPYGRPLANQGYLVLDDTLADCPDGVTGDLYITGVGLADGYWRAPEKTAASFLYCPRRRTAIYKTGDKGRYLADGDIEFLGREDSQVKLRGYRIELGEIEHVLGRHEGIAQAVVHLVRGTALGDMLAAYLVAATDGLDTAACVHDLRADCEASLPSYMRPASYQWLPALPLSANGKVDRAALPAPHIDLAPPAPSDQARGPGAVLMELAARLLGTAVDEEANFFALGGDSISAMRLSAELRQHGLQLDVSAIFGAPTIGALIGLCQPAMPAPQAGCAPAPVDLRDLDAPHDYVDAFRVTPMQRAMLLMSQVDAAAYVNQVRIVVRAGFDAQRFVHAWRRLCERHAILGAHFANLPDCGWVQLQPANPGVPLSEHRGVDDLDALAERRRRFDDGLERRPLSRFDAVHGAEGRVCLLWTFHHALLDGWSLPLLFAELSAVFDAPAAIEPASAPQFRQFAGWLEQQDGAAAQRYWRQYLAGIEHPTRVIHGADESVAAGAIVEQVQHLSAELSAALATVAQRARVTLSTLVRLAWGRTLQILSGDAPVLFGAVDNGRPQAVPDAERMLGLFLNTLPVRLACAPETAVDTCLAQLWQDQQQALAHGWMPLADIQQESGVAPGTALFESIVIVENYPADGLSAGLRGLEIDSITVDSKTHFDLALVVSPGERIAVNLQYQGRLVGPAYAKQVHQLCLRVLEGIAASRADTPLALLHSASPADLLAWERWRGGSGPHPALDILERLDHLGRATPEAPAVACGADSLTYGALHGAVAALAQRLQERQVTEGDAVLVCLPAGASLVVAMLAIWRCGAVYVPVDITQPAARIANIALQARPRLALVHGAGPAVAPAGVTQLAVDAPAPAMAAPPGAPWRCRGAAYLLFTSGTTGQPKGVLIEHAALQAFLAAASARLDAGRQLAVLSVTSATFDISLLEYLLPLAVGGRLLIAGETQRKDGHALARMLEQHAINCLQMTPTGWNILLAGGWRGTPGLTALCGGEPLTAPLARQLLSRCARLFNCYGPTEATIWSMIGEVRDNDLRDGITLSGPLAQSGHLVLDTQRRPVPLGACGELWICGPSLALGYLDNPEQTAERFQMLPDGKGGAVRAYRTGDRVQLRDGAGLVFLGRTDQQIKLHGYRIELAEIEHAIAAVPGVAGVACSVLRVTGQPDRLVAYVVVDGPDSLELAQVAVRDTLPAHMYPHLWQRLDVLPTHVSGKINRSALPAPHCEEMEPGVPATELQARLQELWQQVFGRSPIPLTAGFYALGGNSLLATRLAVHFKQQMPGLELDIRLLLGGASIAAIAQSLEQAYLINKNMSALAGDDAMDEMEW